MRRSFLCVLTLLTALLPACDHNVREASSQLAVQTDRINESLEGFTRTRRLIDAERARLADAVSLDSARTEKTTALRVESWRIRGRRVGREDPRVALFDAARAYADDALRRYEELDELQDKVASMTPSAAGARSAALSDVSGTLVSLSKKRTTAEHLKFLAGYFDDVRDKLKEARGQADAAASRLAADGPPPARTTTAPAPTPAPR